ARAGRRPLMHRGLLAILRCDSCGSPLVSSEQSNGSGVLTCSACDRRVPVVGDIPRFVDRPDDETARRTQASFGYEWTHFNDWRHSGDTNFSDYFQGADLASLGGGLVLD